MKLNVSKFAFTAAFTVGVVYVVCAAFVALLPEFSSMLIGWLVHLVNLEARVVTWAGFFGGLAQAIIYTYLTALLFGWLHNRSVKA